MDLFLRRSNLGEDAHERAHELEEADYWISTAHLPSYGP